MKVLAVLIIAVAFAVQSGLGQTTAAVAVLDRVVGPAYDWRIRPGSQGGPTRVNVNIYFRRLGLVEQTLEAEITFRQTWTDSRLSYAREFGRDAPEYVQIHPLEKSDRRIWTPDTFFQNAYDIETQDLPSPNELLRIHRDGSVLSSQKISLKAPCPMSLEQYPRDRQKCSLDFASYAYTTNDIVYEWKSENPIQMKDGLNLSLPNFLLEEVHPESCTSKTSTGEYSCLRASLVFKRSPANLSSKLYVIPLLLVLFSLLPMIINAQSIIVRVFIGFICLATLILHWSIIGEELPTMGYSTGADVWLTRCLGFIAATLVQLIFYVWIVRVTTSYKERKLAKQSVSKERIVLDVAPKSSAEGDVDVVLIQPEAAVKDRKLGISLLVDLISLAIFVLAFFVFLVHYFTKY